MSTLRRFLSTPEGMAGGLILLVLLMIALLAPFLFPQNPLAISGAPLLPPFEGWAHPLGTDRLGRDVFVGIVYGARSSLTVALASATVRVVFRTSSDAPSFDSTVSWSIRPMGSAAARTTL